MPSVLGTCLWQSGSVTDHFWSQILWWFVFFSWRLPWDDQFGTPILEPARPERSDPVALLVGWNFNLHIEQFFSLSVRLLDTIQKLKNGFIAESCIIIFGSQDRLTAGLCCARAFQKVRQVIGRTSPVSNWHVFFSVFKKWFFDVLR